MRRALHCLVLADDELDALLHTLMARLMKLLTRRGVLVEDMGQTCLAERARRAGLKDSQPLSALDGRRPQGVMR